MGRHWRGKVFIIKKEGEKIKMTGWELNTVSKHFDIKLQGEIIGL
jgi:hypothetical protein